MSERNEYRQILTSARELGRVAIAIDERRDAMDAVRRQLGANPRRRRMGMLIAYGAGVAAAIALVVITGLMPGKVSAAEELANAARATQSYRGWVHIVPEKQFDVLSMFKPAIVSIHINTSDGTLAIIANVYGSSYIEWVSPALHERQLYTGLSHKLVIMTIADQTAQSAIKRNAEFPLKLDDFLGQVKSHGQELPKVTQSTDQNLERFELTLSASTKKDDDSWLASGKITIWADAQTKMIRKMQTLVDGKPLLMDYSYGEPAMKEIYDAGVPRSAQVIDDRHALADGRAPAVFGLPSTAALVKDESITVDALADRLEKRTSADWGDFVSVECQEIKYLSHEEHRQGKVTIAARQGDLALYAIYMVAPEMALWGGQGFPKGWPRPTLGNVDAQLRTARPLVLNAFDGKSAWAVDTSLRMPTTIPVNAATRATPYVQSNIGQMLWPSGFGTPRQITSQPVQNGHFRMQFAHFGTTRSELFRDPARPELLVLHVDATMPLHFNNSKTDYHSDTWYWLDPAHDDLPVETVIRDVSSGPQAAGDVMHFLYLDFARLADGRWYPSHWQYRGVHPPTTQPIIDDGYVEYWRQITQEERLAPQWYGDPNQRIASGQPFFGTTQPVTPR